MRWRLRERWRLRWRALGGGIRGRHQVGRRCRLPVDPLALLLTCHVPLPCVACAFFAPCLTAQHAFGALSVLMAVAPRLRSLELLRVDHWPTLVLQVGVEVAGLEVAGCMWVAAGGGRGWC